MTQVEAVYRHGVFEPLEAVALKEEERVKLTIEPKESDEEYRQRVKAWLEEARAFREKVQARVGILPDSTPEIAADRRR